MLVENTVNSRARLPCEVQPTVALEQLCRQTFLEPFQSTLSPASTELQRRISSLMDVKDGMRNEYRCADKKCNKPLLNKPGALWPCPECRKVTCVACNAQHDSMNCITYKASIIEKSVKPCAPNGTGVSLSDVNGDPSRDSHAGDHEADQGLDQACGGEPVAVEEEDLAPEDFSVDFSPGDLYYCDVNGCPFSVRLLKGSTKFWCPLCHCRHRIEGSKLVKVSRPPLHVTKRIHRGMNF
ncbi:uncharacterized protein LOC119442653 [Dermacentor silvarum]|uniref:uncharacterized protein LOC119442653 n=1 Tax=Dermacentor silvarum TaxID=543639 RepID=UPI00189C23F5|nr:uncharacterized protein LOC119442653 [Dermacentor silvarum]